MIVCMFEYVLMHTYVCMHVCIFVSIDIVLYTCYVV